MYFQASVFDNYQLRTSSVLVLVRHIFGQDSLVVEQSSVDDLRDVLNNLRWL
jgi:hypothetical protein